MTLPQLTHNFLSLIGLTSPTIVDLLQAILDAPYAEWTATGHSPGGTLKAVVLRPNLTAINDVAIIIAGSASAETPPMASPDTWAADTLMVRMCKGIPPATAIVDWTAAAAFGDGVGTCDPCVRVSVLGSLVGLSILESRETLTFTTRTASGVYAWDVGCRFRRASGQHEANGRMVGLWCSGSAGLAANFWTALANQGMLTHRDFNGQCHVRIFVPGSSTVLTPSRLGLLIAPTTTNLLDAAGGISMPPVQMEGGLIARDMFVGPLGRDRGNVAFGANVGAWLVAVQPNADGHAIAFRA